MLSPIHSQEIFYVHTLTIFFSITTEFHILTTARVK